MAQVRVKASNGGYLYTDWDRIKNAANLWDWIKNGDFVILDGGNSSWADDEKLESDDYKNTEIYDNYKAFPAIGDQDTLYIDKETSLTYEWDASNYNYIIKVIE